MEQVTVREANGEVVVFLNKNMGDRLNALREAEKVIRREVIRVESRSANRDDDSN